MARRLYVDMDGVLADFEGHYLAVFGHRHDSVDDDTMWTTIRERPRVEYYERVTYDERTGGATSDTNSHLFAFATDVEIDRDSFQPKSGMVHFYADMPMLKGASEFMRMVSKLDPDLTLLSSCPKLDYQRAATAKRAWYRHHRSSLFLKADNQLLPVLGGKNKALFMHEKRDILVDDWSSNCAAWEKAGGVAIHHKGNYLETYARLAYELNGVKWHD